MGEASRKRQEAARVEMALADIDRDAAAAAVRRVVEALSPGRGVDCTLYAQVGAALLRGLALPAAAVAGSAAWRVGPGDTDVISHAPEVTGQAFEPQDLGPSGLFHAWVDLPTHVVDFSTWTLASKAQLLDASDGGRTQVDWCPASLWAPKTAGLSPRQVVRSLEAGQFSYVRHPHIEPIVFGAGLGRDQAERALEQAGESALLVYKALLQGHHIQVMGVGEDDFQAEAPAVRSRPVPR